MLMRMFVRWAETKGYNTESVRLIRARKPV